MLNYANLSDVEFEYLCQDIMQEKLGVKLHRFARGKDGGIDLTDDVNSKNIIVQVKHYVKSSDSHLMESLKKEVEKVKILSPREYYICCSRELSPQKVDEIYSQFSFCMKSPANIITLSEIDDFLHDSKNLEVLKKHYKLWLDSTGILEDLTSNDLFVDCETLLLDIRRESTLFVKTAAFDAALKHLENNQTIFITGNPGVGKTITSKMLVLHYATMGYKVRFSTDVSDLSALKKSLSRNPDIKEIILVDDCLGQAYFNMREDQNSELISLISYINVSSNKRLILNSRITILQEAKECCSRLVKILEGKYCKLYVLDMSKLSLLDKAKIFYNHTFFMGMDNRYFMEIRKEKRYYDVIKHPNYTPRLIEFVCDPSRYKDVKVSDYYSFIMQQLNNPREIWKDEYEHRLGKVDRLLLLTIYSLSDSMVDEEDVRRCFEERVKHEPDVDMTINQYEASLLRLLDGFIQIVIKNGIKKLRMVNPSVNDYIDGRLSASVLEREQLVASARTIQQKRRLLNDSEFDIFVESIIKYHEVGKYLFTTESQKSVFVTFYLSKYAIFDGLYIERIQAFFKSPQSLFIGDKEVASLIDIFRNILQKDFCEFYGIREFLMKECSLEQIFELFELGDLVEFICLIDKFYRDDSRIQFIEIVLEQLRYAITSYSGGFDIDKFDIDVGAIVQSSCYLSDRGDEEISITKAVEYLQDKVFDLVLADVEEKCSELPNDIKRKLDCFENIEFPDVDLKDVIDSWLSAPYNGEVLPNGDKTIDEVNAEIEVMFERDEGMRETIVENSKDSLTVLLEGLLK